MLGGNSAGIIVPLFFIALSLWSFIITIKSARILKNIFSTWKFRKISSDEAQIRPGISFKTMLKRTYPLYGSLTYSSVQYEVPPICHIFQFLSYISLVWGINFYIAYLNEGIPITFGLITGVISSVFSIFLCKLMHDSFIRTFNKSPTRRDFEKKVADNITILDQKLGELDPEENKTFPVVLVSNCMITFIGGLLSLYSTSSAEEEIFTTGFVLCCLSWVFDPPIRFLASFGLMKLSKTNTYEAEFGQLIIEIDSKDVAWLRVKENYGAEKNESSPIYDNSLHFEYSSGFSPKLKDKSGCSVDAIVNRISPIESEPEQEHSVKISSYRSHNTLPLHNENSEDEETQEIIFFSKKPIPGCPISSSFNSPVKYQSPVKKASQKTGCIHLQQVLMDPKQDLEAPFQFFFKEKEKKQEFQYWKSLIGESPEELNESFPEEGSAKGIMKITEISEKIADSERTDEKNQTFGKEKINLNLTKKEDSKTRAEPGQSKFSRRPSKRKLDSFGNSCLDSFEKSENLAITEDYRADNEGEEEPFSSFRVKSPGKARPEARPPLPLDQPGRLDAGPSILEKMLKIKKNKSFVPTNPKIPEQESKPGKTLISLHRKLISFEEDFEEKSPIMNQFVSPLTISNKDSPNLDFSGKPESQEKPAGLDINLGLGLDSDSNSDSNSNSNSNHLNTQKTEDFRIPTEVLPDQDQAKDSNLDSSLSYSSEHIPKNPPAKLVKKNSSKKMIVNHQSSNGESEDIFDFNKLEKYKSRSGDERKASKPPQRPSKSRENEREVLTSVELKRVSRVDKYFVNKMTESKDLVKDKKVFDKKNNKEIMKNLEKLLEVKENELDEIEITRLKAMLASRQSFKKKHLDAPKDTPYSQKIPNICSDGSTPAEEFKLDPEAIRKREERLKRISSIYSSKRAKSGKKQKKTLSPSKSENFMRKNACL